MKQLIINSLAGMIACSVISCKNNQSAETEKSEMATNQIEKAGWLIGEWENKQDGLNVTEIWKKESDNVFVGRSYTIRNNDTLSSERIRLEQKGDSLFYVPIVKNQNQGQVVKFALTTATDHQLIFENPTHDFPQKITYKLINNDSLFAEISGLYKGEEQSEKFSMHRIH
jgi:hypothetical protein